MHYATHDHPSRSLIGYRRIADINTHFTVHDPDYRASLDDWNSFVDVLTQKLIGIDDLIPELPTKDIVSALLKTCICGVTTRAVQRICMSYLYSSYLLTSHGR